MPVRTALLLVFDNEIRLSFETKIAPKRLDRRVPLRRRQMLVGSWIDIGLVEIVFTFRALRQSAHFVKHPRHGFRAEACDLNQLDAPISFRVLQVPRPPPAGATAAAFNNDRHPAAIPKPT